MKCAVYISITTNKQTASLNYQTEKLTNYAKEQGWELYEVYVDVKTGTNSSKTRQFKKMLQDAEEKKFDIILATEVSRLARNSGLSYKVKRLAEQKELHLITLDGVINTLTHDIFLFGILVWLYEIEAKAASDRIKFALAHRTTYSQNEDV